QLVADALDGVEVGADAFLLPGEAVAQPIGQSLAPLADVELLPSPFSNDHMVERVRVELAKRDVADVEPVEDGAHAPARVRLPDVVDARRESVLVQVEGVAPPAGQVVLLHDEDLLPRPREGDGGGETARARPDDQDVGIHCLSYAGYLYRSL